MNPEDESLREFESAANKTCIARQHAMEAAERTCLGLRIEIQQLTKERDRCVFVAERLAAERDAENLRADKAEAELKSAAQREDALRRELIGHREKAQGNYWAWQGDNDHIESLVTHCPVLIQAKDLQEIISKREKAEADAVELRNTLRRLIPFAQSYRSHPLRNPEDKLDSVLDKCHHALSSDCGKGYILASELEKTIELLSEIEQSPGPYWIAVATCNERIRLESLRKE